MNTSPSIYLASASPRRRELLLQLGVEHNILVTDVDESIVENESAPEYVARLSLNKAIAGWRILTSGEEAESVSRPGLVIGADTCICVDQQILGKPENEQQATKMLLDLSDRDHRVYSAVAIMDQIEYNSLSDEGLSDIYPSSARLEQVLRISETVVSMRKLSIDEIKAYWNSGEPADKAGAYAIQGKAAGFIDRIEGSYSSVMGLPLYETAELLRLHGLEML